MTPAVAARRRALGLVAVALAFLVASAFLLRPQGSPTDAPPPAAATSLPAATTSASTSSPASPSSTAPPTSPTSSGPTVGDLAAPTVVATPVAGGVQFTWSSAGSTPGDTYRVHVGPTEADAEVADPVTVTRTTYTVKAGGGSPVCLRAVVVRSSQVSPSSTAVCASAR